MWRANDGPGRPSATTSAPVASAACMSLDSRWSLSKARASSWRTTSQASCPSASVTSCTAPSSRTSANTGKGSSRSYAPHAASASVVTGPSARPGAHGEVADGDDDGPRELVVPGLLLRVPQHPEVAEAEGDVRQEQGNHPQRG